jgi:DmsE family decaheme c-type cytochrome
MIAWLHPVAFILAFFCAGIAGAAADGDESELPVYSADGADTCITCHSSPEVAGIFRSVHSAASDARGPFGQFQCESCHGPQGRYLPTHGEAITSFGPDAATPVEVQNDVCLDCHKKTADRWKTSAHGAEDLGCADCHVLHTERDTVLTVKGQPDRCYTCHLKERGQMFKPYVHPVRYGKMNCSACHDAHGSSVGFALKRPNLNETCYTCHAEKRGPFVFEHPPAAEDCSLCHEPHGSNHPAMLTRTAPLLCQQCHSQSGHPSVSYTSAGLPDDSPSPFVLVGSCMNCHSEVHGSNHPSGITLMR